MSGTVAGLCFALTDLCYPINDTDDDYMPYAPMTCFVYECKDAEDQNACWNDLWFFRAVDMYQDQLAVFSGNAIETQILCAAFQRVAEKCFPDIAMN